MHATTRTQSALSIPSPPCIPPPPLLSHSLSQTLSHPLPPSLFPPLYAFLLSLFPQFSPPQLTLQDESLPNPPSFTTSSMPPRLQSRLCIRAMANRSSSGMKGHLVPLSWAPSQPQYLFSTVTLLLLLLSCGVPRADSASESAGDPAQLRGQGPGRPFSTDINCSPWSWRTCIHLGRGVRVLAVNPEQGSGEGYRQDLSSWSYTTSMHYITTLHHYATSSPGRAVRALAAIPEQGSGEGGCQGSGAPRAHPKALGLLYITTIYTVLHYITTIHHYIIRNHHSALLLRIAESLQ